MRPLVIPLLATGLALAFASLRLCTLPAPRLADPPDVALADLTGYASQADAFAPERLAPLPADTRVTCRRYCDAARRRYTVTAVLTGRDSRASIHRPEVCLPCQGFTIASERTATVDGVEWRRLSLRTQDGGKQDFAYTFVNQAGFATSSHAHRIAQDMFDLAVRRRINRWVMLTAFAPESTAGELDAFLADANALLPRAAAQRPSRPSSSTSAR